MSRIDCIVLYCAVLHCTVLYLLSRMALSRIILYCIVRYCTVLYCVSSAHLDESASHGADKPLMTPTKSSTSSSSSSSSSFFVKCGRHSPALVALVSLTAATFLLFYFADLQLRRPFLGGSDSDSDRTRVRNLDSRTPADAEDFEQSPSFRAMVRAETGNQDGSVAAYLASVGQYLLAFRSPVIREAPIRYSWPAETASEQEQQTRRTELRLAAAGFNDDSKSNATSGAWAGKLVVWYNAPDYLTPSDQVFDHCPVKSCRVSRDYAKDHASADAVLFHGCPAGDVAVPPRDRASQIYVFYTMESPVYTLGGCANTQWNSVSGCVCRLSVSLILSP